MRIAVRCARVRRHAAAGQEVRASAQSDKPDGGLFFRLHMLRYAVRLRQVTMVSAIPASIP
jgi:hypothetical protein